MDRRTQSLACAALSLFLSAPHAGADSELFPPVSSFAAAQDAAAEAPLPGEGKDFEQDLSTYHGEVEAWEDLIAGTRRLDTPPHPAGAWRPRMRIWADGGEARAWLWLAENLRSLGISRTPRRRLAREVFGVLFTDCLEEPWMDRVAFALVLNRRELDEASSLAWCANLEDKGQDASVRGAALWARAEVRAAGGRSRDPEALGEAMAMREAVMSRYPGTEAAMRCGDSAYGQLLDELREMQRTFYRQEEFDAETNSPMHQLYPRFDELARLGSGKASWWISRNVDKSKLAADAQLSRRFEALGSVVANGSDSDWFEDAQKEFLAAGSAAPAGLAHTWTGDSDAGDSGTGDSGTGDSGTGDTGLRLLGLGASLLGVEGREEEGALSLLSASQAAPDAPWSGWALERARGPLLWRIGGVAPRITGWDGEGEIRGVGGVSTRVLWVQYTDVARAPSPEEFTLLAERLDRACPGVLAVLLVGIEGESVDVRRFEGAHSLALLVQPAELEEFGDLPSSWIVDRAGSLRGKDLEGLARSFLLELCGAEGLPVHPAEDTALVREDVMDWAQEYHNAREEHALDLADVRAFGDAEELASLEAEPPIFDFYPLFRGAAWGGSAEAMAWLLEQGPGLPVSVSLATDEFRRLVDQLSRIEGDGKVLDAAVQRIGPWGSRVGAGAVKAAYEGLVGGPGASAVRARALLELARIDLREDRQSLGLSRLDRLLSEFENTPSTEDAENLRSGFPTLLPGDDGDG